MDHRLTSFELLTPEVVLSAVEAAFDLSLDGTLTTFPSYINRVYGIRTDDGVEYVTKFYRPGRWQRSAIVEEHDFLKECAAEEIPVIPPIPDVDRETLHEVEVVSDRREESFLFSLFAKKGGRGFDAEGDEQWVRLGSVVARCHTVGRRHVAANRLVCTPSAWTVPFVDELLIQKLVHPEVEAEFRDLVEGMVAHLEPLFSGIPSHRIHGDCHRGNLLERPGEGLLVIDFDDMMVGPAVQDIWLLLPGYAEECRREITLLLEGYETFLPFPRETLRLIEPLRFMRMLHFIAWQARQRQDHWFAGEHPDWGTKQFWIRELEDLRTQARIVAGTIDIKT